MNQSPGPMETTDLIQAAFKLSGIEERRVQMRSLLAQIPGVDLADHIPKMEWFVLTTSGYLVGPPLSYYWEPAFLEYTKALRSCFASTSEFAAEGTSVTGLIDAVFRAEHLAFEIAKEDLSGHHMTVAVRQYLVRWYLELCEQILDVLLQLPARGIARRSGKTAPRALRSLVQILEKAGWMTAGEGYNPTVRNGIAHELTFETDFAGTVKYAVFTDERGNQERRTLEELRDDVDLLLDRALGYALALRLHLLQHLAEPGVAQLVAPTSLTPEVREQAFRDFTSVDRFKTEGASIDVVSNKRQLTVHGVESTDHDVERLAQIIRILYEAASWFPDAERVFVGVKGKGKLAGFVTTDGATLRRWASGEISGQEFFNKVDRMLFPIMRPFGRLRHKLRYAANVFRAEFRHRFEAPWPGPRYRFLSRQDTSTALAHTYQAEALLQDAPSEEPIRAALQDAVRRLRGMAIHRNRQVRKRWGRTPPHYVSVFLYAREKRRRDRWADSGSAFYLGRAEFRDPHFHGVLPESKLREVVADGLTLEVSPNWQRARTPVPALEDTTGRDQ